MLDIEKKYLALANIPIRREYKNQLKFRCPVCGDSKTNKFKARGYLSETSEGAVYHCFNCEFSGTFAQLLEQVDMTLKDSYNREIGKDKREKFLEKKNELDVFKKTEVTVQAPDEIKTNSVLIDGEEYQVTTLTNSAIEYLKFRCVAEDDFKHFRSLPGMNAVIVFLKHEKIFGFQVRSIVGKFFHNYVQEGRDKCWNLDYVMTLPKGTDVYVFESIFNALSVSTKNVLAGLGSSLSPALLKLLKDYNLIFCYDNDGTGVKKTIQFTEKGYSALLHHEKFLWVDFNEARQAGVTSEQLLGYITANTLSARMANMKLRLRGLI